MLKTSLIFLTILYLTALTGCGSIFYRETKDADLVDVSYDAVETLKHDLKVRIPHGSLIIVSSLLHVDDLQKTSAFGRIISDQIASGLHNAGYRIIGMEFPIDLFTMAEGGTLHLTDEIKEKIKPYGAATIVGGVYAPGKKNVYVSLRMVDIVTRNIISSTDYSVPMGPDAKALVKSKDVGSTGSHPEQTADAKPDATSDDAEPDITGITGLEDNTSE